MLETMENERPDLRLYQRHTLPLPSCCPVSGNPHPGSSIRISYRAAARVLEVYSLGAYLRSFVGGHPSGVRTMEGMIQQVASDCVEALGVSVAVRASVQLLAEPIIDREYGKVRLDGSHYHGYHCCLSWGDREGDDSGGSHFGNEAAEALCRAALAAARRSKAAGAAEPSP